MYSQQYSYVNSILHKFDDPKYNEEDQKMRVELVDLLQKVFLSLDLSEFLDAGIGAHAKGNHVRDGTWN
jgi:hypothetical protein